MASGAATESAPRLPYHTRESRSSFATILKATKSAALTSPVMVQRVAVAPQDDLGGFKRLRQVVDLSRARNSRDSTASTSIVSIVTHPRESKRSRSTPPPDTATASLQNESAWLFELHSVSTLPIVNLERTLLSVCSLPKPIHDAIARRAHSRHRNLYVLVRLALLAFTLLVFVRTRASAPALFVWFTVGIALCFAAVPLLVLVALSALDVMGLLLSTYECWFVSVVNTVHWICVADIVGAPRSLLCSVAWLSIQSVAMLDANFRAFSAASKAAIAGIPLLLALAVACALGLVSDARFALLSSRGGFPVDTGSVVVFTSSTLTLFMAKKVYATRHQLQERELSLARYRVVPCVVLKTRLALRPWRSGRRAAMVGSAHLRNQANMRQLLSATRQPLRGSHHWSTTFVIDARRTLLPLVYRVWLSVASDSRGSRAMGMLVAVAGGVGFAASVVAWTLLFLTCPRELVEAKWITGVIAAGGSHAYVTTTFLLCQRDLILALVTNFDLMFTTFQCQALALTMMDMMQWRPHDCLAVAAWWLWFNWLLLHDALTPPVKRLLRYRRRVALCVIVWVLAIVVAIMALIFADDRPVGEHSLLADRQVWSFHWQGMRSFELHTKDFAVQRVATIVGWSTRLVFELARPDRHEELLFIRQPLEYSCPSLLHSCRSSASSRRLDSRSSTRRRTQGAGLTTPTLAEALSSSFADHIEAIGAAKVVPIGSSKRLASDGLGVWR